MHRTSGPGRVALIYVCHLFNRPDGRTLAFMSARKTSLCPGTRICCPKCGQLLQHVSLRNGDSFAQCERHRCRAHFFVTCTRRLCTVLEVTQKERARFEADQSTCEEILAELGVRLTGVK